MHSYCCGAMPWKSQVARVSRYRIPSTRTHRILRDHPRNILWTLCYMFNSWLRVSTVRCPLVEPLRFLSHPAPFCFQIARYTGIEDCQGFCQQSEDFIVFLSSVAFSCLLFIMYYSRTTCHCIFMNHLTYWVGYLYNLSNYGNWCLWLLSFNFLANFTIHLCLIL